MKRSCACLGGSHHLAGRQSQRHFVPEKGGPGGGRRGQLTSAGAPFSHSSHNLAHSGSWAFFLYNLLQTGTWPEPHLRQARHRPAEGNLPSQLWLCQSPRGRALSTQHRRVWLRICKRLQGKNRSFGVTRQKGEPNQGSSHPSRGALTCTMGRAPPSLAGFS